MYYSATDNFKGDCLFNVRKNKAEAEPEPRNLLDSDGVMEGCLHPEGQIESDNILHPKTVRTTPMTEEEAQDLERRAG